jgi:nucleotide sugar dehydrogenase
MKLLSIGFGFVGKAYSIFLRESGHDVSVLTKKDQTYEEARNYNFREPLDGETFDAAIIAVPTPTNNGISDISIVEEAIEIATKKYHAKNIIIKSTVPPGSTRSFASKNPGYEFYFYPEFLEAKNPIGMVFNQKIMVFGNDKWTPEKKQFTGNLFRFREPALTDFETAETLKYIHNIWLACNISLWNSVIRTCSQSVDYEFLLSQIHQSEYFGTHPWKIGEAFGGYCLPKDLEAYIAQIKGNNAYKVFIKAIKDVNEAVKNEK